jgi:hypothetical protein
MRARRRHLMDGRAQTFRSDAERSSFGAVSRWRHLEITNSNCYSSGLLDGRTDDDVRSGDSFSYFMYRSEICGTIQPFSDWLCSLDVMCGIRVALHERFRRMFATHEISCLAHVTTDQRIPT